MDAIAWIGAGIFVFGYVLIALEQRFNTHKSAIALMMGGALWVLAALHLNDTAELTRLANETSINVFSVVAFTLAAMTLIEILIHYRFFDYVRMQLLRLHLTDKHQFLLMMAMTFLLSAVLDNISVTIAMLQIGRRFFKGRNLLIAASGVVIAANAGGAWSPIGDVTSLLLWLGGKLSAPEMIQYALLPSIVLMLVSGALLYRKMKPVETIDKPAEEEKIVLLPSEKLIIGMALFSFILPVFVNIIGVPPYLGRFFGLGLTWSLIELFRTRGRSPQSSHMSANIEKLLPLIDLSSIKFIMGVLISVGALAALGVLSYVSEVTLGTAPGEGTIIATNIGLGLLSSIVDNSSLVAIAMQVFPDLDPQLWGLTAVLAGTGGSILVIGSAAGVVAMGSMKELTFQRYAQIATVPALAGFVAAIGTWYLQNNL